MDKVAFPGPKGRIGHPDHTHFIGQTPERGTAHRLLITRRVIELAGASPSGAWRLLALPDGRQTQAQLVLPDGHRLVRALGDALGDVVFTADDAAVLVTRSSGVIVRIDLRTGERRRVGATDGALSTP